MKKLLLIGLLAFSICLNDASAINLRVERRDLKLATQQLLEKETFLRPISQQSNYILSTEATSSSAETDITTFDNQPDVCRALNILPGGTTADVPSGNILIDGADANGNPIQEIFTLSANQSTIEVGTKAFCSVSAVKFPVQDGASATYDVGISNKLGLDRCMDSKHHVIKVIFNGDSTVQADQSVVAGGTIVHDATSVAKNLVDPESPLDNGKDVEVFFIQNFRCLP